VLLPAGARVTTIEVNGCDTNAGNDFAVSLIRSPVQEGAGVVLATATSSGSPGCAFFSAALATPETIDNQNNSYWLEFVNLPPGTVDNTNRFQAVRVFYELQVSPAPVAATFGDVPTSHPFFQFVEALVASGITAGCGGGNYCPDNPVTRGQMAVFISKALGLHFAP
jgi:hypothetical protein